MDTPVPPPISNADQVQAEAEALLKEAARLAHQSGTSTPQKQRFNIAEWLVKSGLAKTDVEATMVLFFLILICFAISAWIFWSGQRREAGSTISPPERARMMQQ